MTGRTDERWYRCALGLGRLALRALDVTLDVSGLETVPTDGPVVLAATHVSYPDFLPIGVAAHRRGRYVRFMTRHDVWDRRWRAAPMSSMQHVPVDRQAPAAAYLHARRLLREGHAVGTFPEAGISYSFTVRSLMRGTAALAQETGAVVVPVALWGIQRIYTVGRPVDGVEPPPDWTRGRRVDLAFGEPTTVGPGEDLTEWTTKLGLTLTQMLEGLQQLPHHQPRPGEHAPWHPAHLGGHAPDRDEARTLDSVPRSAVPPVWGPPHGPAPHRQAGLSPAPATPGAPGVVGATSPGC